MQGLKNLQEFSDAGASGAGEPTPEAALAKKMKDIKGMRSMKEREEKRKAKAAEKVGSRRGAQHNWGALRRERAWGN